MSLDSAIRSQSKPVILAVATAIMSVITWLDYLCGPEISLGVFYALPIIGVVWYVNRGWGIAMAVLCMLAWALANSVGESVLEKKGVFLWAMLSRFVYFACIAVGAAAIRKQQEIDQARIAVLEHARKLERDIVNVSEHEQRRIGQDIHDGLCQVLAGIGCAVTMLKDELHAKSLPEAGSAEQIEGYVRDAVTEARDLARGIFPVLKDATDLESALDELAVFSSKLHRRQIIFTHDDGIKIGNPEVAMHLYRIAQEALSNAMKHAKAENVTVSFRRENGVVRLVVGDDGIGLPKSTSSAGMGLRTMKYRAELIGAKLEMVPRPSGGTLITCEIDPDNLAKPKHQNGGEH